ncbi:MAG TPA: aminotransferase class V-fold PLP-dependent enzyme [Candidatus Acidoferrales bacterium]|nr:aminotransferase class V-fold PLP-dependent enzyme [Candidatus Acidoferrales bacterium]
MMPTPPLARSAFALEPGLIYLNHAATGVLPIRARDAVVEAVQRHAAGGVLAIAAQEQAAEVTRERVAHFIGASRDDVAFIRNTSDGANILARGLDWRPGDEIVISDNEFGANAYPWLALREYGVVVRMIETARERMTPDVLARLMTPRTKVVSVSWVSFADGYRHDLGALCAVAHDGGALFFVDAIQALGAFPIDVGALAIDALFSGGHKWLLSLPGLGILYVTQALRERLSVRLPGWRSVENIWNFLNYDQPWAPNASRYESGAQNLLGAIALRHALEVLSEADVTKIAEHVVKLTEYLVDRLASLGISAVSMRGPGISSGIVTIWPRGDDPTEIGRRLQHKAKIVTTYRPNGIRLSPHGYNTFQEIDAFVDGIAVVR